ncbi:hypothetical protein SRHO_G00066130 [Serrasalmus rhombeus]
MGRGLARTAVLGVRDAALLSQRPYFYHRNQALNKENLQSDASRSAPASAVPSVCPTGYRHANQGHSVSPSASQGSSAASFFLSFWQSCQHVEFSLPIEFAEACKAAQRNVVKCHRSVPELNRLTVCNIQMGED